MREGGKNEELCVCIVGVEVERPLPLGRPKGK